MSDSGWKPGKYLKKGVERIKGSGESASKISEDSEVPMAAAASEQEPPQFDGNEERESEFHDAQESSLSSRNIQLTSEPFYLNIVVVDSSEVALIL